MAETYTVVLVPEPEGEFSVRVPALPGCFSRGKTVGEALRNAEEAIECYLRSVIKHGEPIPREGDTVPLPTRDLTEALVFKVSLALEDLQPA